MYICLEGIKGSGKSTVFELVKKKLEQEGLSFSIICPTKPISSFNIREWIHSHFHFLRKFDWWNSWIYSLRSNKSALIALREKKSLIIGDRSILTSYVTKRIHGVSWNGVIDLVNRMENLIPLPDVVMYFRIDPNQALKRLQKRRNHLSVKKDETLNSLYKAEEIYAEIRNHKIIPQLSGIEWIELDGAMDPSDLSRYIVTFINIHLKQQNNDLHNFKGERSTSSEIR